MKQNALLLLAVLVIIGSYLSPLARPGMIAGHDTGYHLTRIQLFTQALREGQFPVRWIEGPVPGITHPLFEFYPPLFYYAVAPFMFMGIPYTIATYLVLALTTILAWTGMYVFIKILLTNHQSPITNNQLSVSSLIAATLFLFTPYRVSELYVRAAYGELLATAFIPWAFWGVSKQFQIARVAGVGGPPGRGPLAGFPGGKRLTGPAQIIYTILLAFSLAFMVMSHQPTAIIAAFPLALWAIYQFLKTQNIWGVLRLGVAGVIAFGLSAFFTIPMIAESGLIRAARLSGGYFDFRQHFALLGQLLYSVWGYGVSMRGPGDGMSFQVGIVNWVVLLTAAALVFYNLYNRYKHYNHYNDYSIFFLILAAFGIFMATAVSEPIWERFTVLGYIQYPWRFLLMISFATSALSGFVLYNFYNYYNRYNRYIFLFLLLPILFNLKYLTPSAYMPANTFDLGNPDLSRYNSPENPFFGVELGYFPIWVNEVNTDPATKRFAVTKGKADVTPGVDTMIRQEAKLKVSEVSTIRVNTHYFPGWMAAIHDGKTTKEVVPAYNNPQGDMEINLIPGDYTLTMKFGSTPIRRIADYLSLGTLAGVAISMLLMISPKRFWSKYTGATSPARVKRSKA